MQYGERLKTALVRLYSSTVKMKKAEDDAIKTLATVLRPIGEHGVTITCLDDCAEGEFISIAEVEPFNFKPVALARYNEKNDQVEVFVSEWEEYGKSVSEEGKWMNIKDANVDIHLLLDNVKVYLEYADYYDED